VNFLLALRERVEAASRSKKRTLCLLVLYNRHLIPAWENTLNNDTLTAAQDRYKRQKSREEDEALDSDTIGHLIDVLEGEKCWKDGHGLSTWNTQVKGPPRIQADRTFGVDVVITTAQTLQNDRGSWIFDSDWHTVIADEAHDFLRGQQTTQSHTLKMWFMLQSQTFSMFLLTGTPFMTKITHDFVAITRAVALNSKRGLWSPDCTDEGLRKLVQGWVGVADRRYQNDREKEKQSSIRQEMTATLAIFTIRRDEKSVVRGEKVMKDFLSACLNIEDPLQPTDGGAEVREREDKYAAWRGQNDKRLTQRRNDDMRCLCFSYRFIKWSNCSDTDRARIWDSYTLAEGNCHIRTKALIEELRLAKTTGNKIIIYVQRRFLAELAMKVRTSHTFTNT